MTPLSTLSKLILIISTLTPPSRGLDEKSVFEKKCFKPDTSVELDYTWVFSHSRWYFTLMSKLDLYRTTSDILRKELKDISAADVETPCIHADWEGMTPTILGFNGKRLEYDISPGFDNTFTYDGVWEKGLGAKMYLVKTDNKSYILFIKCWKDDQISWNVMSTSKTLDDDIKEEIYKTIKSYGLSLDLTFEQKFESCEIKEVKSEL